MTAQHTDDDKDIFGGYGERAPDNLWLACPAAGCTAVFRRQGRKKFCSQRCGNAHRYRMRHAALTKRRRCERQGCPEFFWPKSNSQKYCTSSCREVVIAARRKRAPVWRRRTCKARDCRKKFKTDKFNQVYCSKTCVDRIRARRYRKAHPEAREKYRQQSAQYREECRDYLKKQKAANYQRNREKRLKYRREYYEKNKEACQAAARAYREKKAEAAA